MDRLAQQDIKFLEAVPPA